MAAPHMRGIFLEGIPGCRNIKSGFAKCIFYSNFVADEKNYHYY